MAVQAAALPKQAPADFKGLVAAGTKIGTFFEKGLPDMGYGGTPDLKGDVIVGAKAIGEPNGWGSVADAQKALKELTKGQQGSVGLFLENGRVVAHELQKTDGKNTWGVNLFKELQLTATDKSWLGAVSGDQAIIFNA